jgi:hypothetical protein
VDASRALSGFSRCLDPIREATPIAVKASLAAIPAVLSHRALRSDEVKQGHSERQRQRDIVAFWIVIA